MSAGFVALLNQTAAMSKQATVTTAGIVGDDLAINSQQLIGGQPDRKLPMVYAVGKGSFKNKFLYLIPAALALSVTLPGLIMPALTIGGAYLCFEGVEKFFEKKPKPTGKSEAQVRDHAAWEKRHVKKAIKTDLILSAEITAVSLWTVAAAPILVQVAAMAVAGIAMTVGVYGVVGGIIKLPDIGAALEKKKGDGIVARAQRGLGRALTATAPGVIKTVGLIGTVAMFLVGGGMVLHGIPGADTLVTGALNTLTTNSIVQAVAMGAAETAAGLLAGLAALPVMKVIEPPLERAYEFVKNKVRKLLPKAPAANDDDDAAPTPVAAPVASAPAPTKAPDAKTALNTAAAPQATVPANDSQTPQKEAKPPKTPAP